MSRLVVCLALVAAWTVLVVPGTAVAKGKPGSDETGGKFETQGFWVWFSEDSLGAFDPNGPAPEGSAANGTDGGSMSVSAGSIGSKTDTRMIVNTNMTVLTSFFGAQTSRSALESDGQFLTPSYDDFVFCIPELSGDTMLISENEDGTVVSIHLSGRSFSGRYLGYYLTIHVSVDAWDPLALAPGETMILTCGRWDLTTSNLKKQSKGCSASGNFSNDTVVITVKRWTQDEQDYQDANE